MNKENKLAMRVVTMDNDKELRKWTEIEEHQLFAEIEMLFQIHKGSKIEIIRTVPEKRK